MQPPLIPSAVTEADQSFRDAHKDDRKFSESHPDGKLTLSEEDQELRREWMGLYKNAAAKEIPATDRSVGSTVQMCPVGQDPNNWIIVKYLYPSRSWRPEPKGVPNAKFVVLRDTDRAEVASGMLDEHGYKRVDGLPLDVSRVLINFSSDPEPFTIFPQCQPKPHNLSRPDPEYFEMARVVIQAYLDQKLREAKWVWGSLQGDFNKDPDLGQIILGTVISLIPVVDQITDVRDLSANIIALYEADDLKDFWLWFALVMSLVGCIPELGTAIKGVFKSAFRAIKEATHIPVRALIAMLNSIGEGHAVRWFKQLSADLHGKHIPWLVEKLKSILGDLIARIHSLKAWVTKQAAERLDKISMKLTQLRELAQEMIQEVVGRVKKWLDDLLSESKHIETPGSTKGTNTYRQEEKLFPNKAQEVKLSQEEYKSALSRVFPSHQLDSIAKTVDEIGERAAERVANDPRFISAMDKGDWKTAGNLFHTAAKDEARALSPGTLPNGWQLTAEETIKAGKGGSRVDLLLRGPAGELVEFDWKTTGQSALSSSARKEMSKHAGHILVHPQGGKVSSQESRSWLDYVRPHFPVKVP